MPRAQVNREKNYLKRSFWQGVGSYLKTLSSGENTSNMDQKSFSCHLNWSVVNTDQALCTSLCLLLAIQLVGYRICFV